MLITHIRAPRTRNQTRARFMLSCLKLVAGQRAGLWKSPERKEPSGALLAFDGKAHPRPNGPLQTGLKRLPRSALRPLADVSR
jgi:hypothetical protein